MEFITYEVEGQVGIITINRPKALNALNSAVLDELDATIDGVDLDAVRCLILTGAGEKSFVAGADIAEMSTLTKEEGEAFGKKGNDIFRKIETLPITVFRRCHTCPFFKNTTEIIGISVPGFHTDLFDTLLRFHKLLFRIFDPQIVHIIYVIDIL